MPAVMDPIYDFAWRVQSGYRWTNGTVIAATDGLVEDRDGKAISGRFLTSGRTMGAPYEFTQYCPLMRESELYRKFAALFDDRLSGKETLRRFMGREPEPPEAVAAFEESTRAFAVEYGSLTDDQFAWIDVDGEMIGGEPMYLWRQHAEAMHGVVAALENGAAQTKHIQETINKHLEGRVSPRLLWLSSANLERMVLRMVPENLLGAMWLQAARAVDENRLYRPCEMCGTIMQFARDATGRASRIDRLTCSEKCRSAHHRARRRTLAFAKGKMSVEAIVDELGGRVPADVVRKWLEGRRRRRKARMLVRP